jgi:hypothetical protein
LKNDVWSTLILPDNHRIPFLAIAVCAALGVICGFACYLFAGNSLDLFIGSVFFTAIVVPYLSAIAGRLPDADYNLLGFGTGLALTWLTAVHAGAISAQQWFMCVLVAFSFAAMLMSGVCLLIRLRCLPLVAAAILTVIALLWLSWPVWLAESLVGSQLHYSTLFHPLFAINHIVSNLGIWSEQQVAYNMTTLGQDAQYQLPTSAWSAIGLQVMSAAALTAPLLRRKVTL